MVAIGLIISVLLGISIVLLISRKLTLIEIIGLAFPVGIGVQSVLMILLDSFSVPLNAFSMLSISLAVMLLVCIYLFLKKKTEMQNWFSTATKFSVPKINALWLLLLLALVAAEAMNFGKCIYFPPFDRDSLTSFNTIALIVAKEQTFHNLSLFRDPGFAEYFTGGGSTLSYTPFAQCSYAYVYMLGAATSKMVNALHYLSFIIVFYGLTRRFVTDTAAMFATFFAFVTPEFISFSSLSGTNVLHSCYAVLGILYLVLWSKERDRSYLWLSAVLLWLNIWTRNEGVAFVGSAVLFMLVDAVRHRNYKPFIIFTAFTVSAFVLWNIYLKIFGMNSLQVFIFYPFWDGLKIKTMADEMWMLFTNKVYYGWTIPLFVLFLLSNVYYIWKWKDQVPLLALTFGALFIYTLLLYQIDYVWDTIENVIRFSYKRFLFSFIPLFWFYIVANHNSSVLFNWIDRFVYREKIGK